MIDSTGSIPCVVIHSSILFVHFIAEGGLLKGIETLFERVMIPALKKRENWGALSEEESKKSPVVNNCVLVGLRKVASVQNPF